MKQSLNSRRRPRSEQSSAKLHNTSAVVGLPKEEFIVKTYRRAGGPTSTNAARYPEAWLAALLMLIGWRTGDNAVDQLQIIPPSE